MNYVRITPQRVHWAQNGGIYTPAACGIKRWSQAILGDTFEMYDRITCAKCRKLAIAHKKESYGIKKR